MAMSRSARRAADDAAFAEVLIQAADKSGSSPADHVRRFTGKTLARLTEALEKGVADPSLEADLESYEAELMDALGIVP